MSVSTQLKLPITNAKDRPKGTRLGLIAATYYLPKIPTTFVVAWCVDKFGRKIPLVSVLRPSV